MNEVPPFVILLEYPLPPLLGDVIFEWYLITRAILVFNPEGPDLTLKVPQAVDCVTSLETVNIRGMSFSFTHYKK